MSVEHTQDSIESFFDRFGNIPLELSRYPGYVVIQCKQCKYQIFSGAPRFIEEIGLERFLLLVFKHEHGRP